MRQYVVACWCFTHFLRDSGPEVDSLLLAVSPEEYRKMWLHWEMTFRKCCRTFGVCLA